MNRLTKTKAASLAKADAAADIELVNQYSVRQLEPGEVFCFSVVLCDNDVDRDTERFSDRALDTLAPLFLGKTGIIDHRWRMENQVARIYRTDVEQTGEKNSLGEPRKVLRADAYMLHGEANAALIDAIGAGIVKEVSVGFASPRAKCSICGETLEYQWSTGKTLCENGHIQGNIIDGKLCYGLIDSPTDAYEFSFVAVPAQRGAGVTKGAEDLSGAFDLLMAADISAHADRIKALMPRLQMALINADEREERARILAENQKYLN
jgi:hypothetical protein